MQYRTVVIESPFRGSHERNLMYLRACMKDCLDRQESPYASHGLLTQVLDDNDPKERLTGIDAGLAWKNKADATVVYIDLGISEGMKKGIDCSYQVGHPIQHRTLGETWKKQVRREIQDSIVSFGIWGALFGACLGGVMGFFVGGVLCATLAGWWRKRSLGV